MNDSELREIFETHKDAVYGFAWRMTGSPDAAEDVAQDTFLQLLEANGRFDATRGPVRAWLFGVARNLILKRWRSEGRWAALDDDDFAVAPLAGDCRAEERVAHAVQSLPPLQREAIVLIEYEGMSLAETAAAVAAEVGTVKARLHRARENLRQILEPLRRTNHD